jgi:hypothetical protein
MILKLSKTLSALGRRGSKAKRKDVQKDEEVNEGGDGEMKRREIGDNFPAPLSLLLFVVTFPAESTSCGELSLRSHASRLRGCGLGGLAGCIPSENCSGWSMRRILGD